MDAADAEDSSMEFMLGTPPYPSEYLNTSGVVFVLLAIAVDVCGVAAPASVANRNPFEREFRHILGDPVCNVWHVLPCVALAAQVQVVGGECRELLVERNQRVRVSLCLRSVVPRACRLHFSLFRTG